MNGAVATQKRNRAQLSCTSCRFAKSKCDRKEPCSQCIKRGKESQCVIPTPTPRRKPVVSMQNRLKHLEGLVTAAMSNQTGSQGIPVPLDDHRDPDPNAKGIGTESSNTPDLSSGQILVDNTNNETTYVGATHWAAILEDIEEVKTYFYEELERDDDDEQGDAPTPALIFDIGSPVKAHDILAALPSRIVVDQLLSRYFNSNSPTLHIIHLPTFQKEYQRFWTNQNQTPMAWVSLLYAMLVIATCVMIGAGDGSLDERGSPSQMIHSYRQCCVQALVLSHYTKPGPYTLESFMIYMEGEFLLSTVDQVQCYLLLGTAARLVLRMGLHRDPSKVGGQMSSFQGEMRRRLWHHLKQIDMLGAFHIGLPSALQGIDSDTLLPSNYRDEDLDESCKELPVPRPESELTPISYMICKSRIGDVSSKIAAVANVLSLPPYEEVLKLDSQLLEAHGRLPHFFQLPSSGIYITDRPELIVKRISLELLFQKSRCMLHRKCLVKEKEDSRFTYSKTAGLDASWKLLRIQALAHEACLPGGVLHGDRWFQSALSTHDFLLAAMIVYLSVIRDIGSNGSSADGLPSEQRNAVTALQESYRIWTWNTNKSPEAKRAAAVLKIMLKKINLASARHKSHSTIPTGTVDRCENNMSNPISSNLITHLSINSDTSGTNSSSLLSPANLSLDMESSAPVSFSGSELPLEIDLSFLPMESWEEMPSDFNWELFDNHIRPQEPSEHAWPDFANNDFETPNNNYDNFNH